MPEKPLPERPTGNPYVGPRPFERDERLYGREDEIRELRYLWMAERIVLFHSPSGAGKSSLLQAGLLPEIDASFDVWGPTRVHQELPAGVDSSANRYATSALLGFENGVPEPLRRPAEALAGIRLADYVATRPRQRKKADRPVALVFDQFEEILTADPLAVDAKREFFDQLGELMRDPRIWALFVLREDFLAPLHPYAARVPTHLENRFRIDLLDLDGAREAIVRPARVGGREFPAADRLVRDLATRKVQQADGSFVEEVGTHVEPVQLQVVCFRLWDAMPADDLSIDETDLDEYGDVTESLAGYYADSVRRVAGGSRERERAIREWFGTRLIRAGDVRGQVLRGAESSDGLDHAEVEELLDTHLVRAESRAGATWYELAHDRLIEPVRADNARWRAEHLSEVQERAALWEQQGYPPGLLLRDESLAEADAWLASSGIATATEIRFLEASHRAQEVLDRERRQTARIRRLGIAAMVIAVLALAAGVFAIFQMAEAERQRADAEIQRRAAETQRLEAEHQREDAVHQREEADRQRRAALDEKQAADAARQEAEKQTRLAREQERRALENQREAERQRREADEARAQAEKASLEAIAASQVAEEAYFAELEAREQADRLQRLAEARALAVEIRGMTQEELRDRSALLALEAYRRYRDAGGEADAPQIYDALRLAVERLDSPTFRRLPGHTGAVRAIAVEPTGGRLASGGDDGVVHLLDPHSPSAEARSLAPAFFDGVRALAWSPDGRRLAAASVGGALRLWSAERPGESPRILRVAGPTLHALAFSSPAELVAGDCAGAVMLFDLDAEPNAPPRSLQAGVESATCDPLDGPAPPAVRAFAVHGTSLAAASDQRGVLFWRDLGASDPPRAFATDTAARSVAIRPDGRTLAAGTVDGFVLTWNLASPAAEPVERVGHTARVEALAFHPSTGGFLASASLDGTLRLWDVENADALPLVLEGHDGWVWAAAFSPDGEALFSGGADRTVRLWTTSSEVLADEACRVVGTRALDPAEWREYFGDEPYRVTCPEEMDR